jgi:hypothetical protein
MDKAPLTELLAMMNASRRRFGLAGKSAIFNGLSETDGYVLKNAAARNRKFSWMYLSTGH